MLEKIQILGTQLLASSIDLHGQWSCNVIKSVNIRVTCCVVLERYGTSVV